MTNYDFSENRIVLFLGKHNHFWRVMKLTSILLLLICMHVSATSISQTVSLKASKQPLSDVLGMLKKQTKFRIMYNDRFIDPMMLVTADITRQPLEEALNTLLLPHKLTYHIEGKTIIIKAIEKDSVQKQLATSTLAPVNKAIVKGKITDDKGMPLPGALIQLKGTDTKAVSDASGEYVINISTSEAVLSVSFVGFETQEIPVRGNKVIDVKMIPIEKGLDQVVVVGYGTQKRQSVTGAISQISGSELLKAPVGNLNNLIAGRVAGVVSLQTSGRPGADAAAILVRGGSAKYIVDGFERSFSEIDPNEVETISVLKDAAAASVFGLDASSVIIITTKRGKQAPSKISFSGAYGLSQNALMMEMLDGPSYAYWYNKAREMDGNSQVFTIDQVRKMEQGIDGWGNTNWYKETFGTGKNQNFNVNAAGGTDKIKYFVSLGNYNQKGNVKNFDYNRYNFRSNIDAVIVNNLDLSFDIAGRMQNQESPLFSGTNGDFNNIPQQAIRALPYVPKEIDGYPVSTRTVAPFVSPLAASTLSGYNDRISNVFQSNLSLNFRVPQVKGLSLKFLGSYDITFSTMKRFSIPFQTMVANNPTMTTDKLTYTLNYDSRGNEESLIESLSKTSNLRTNFSVRYDNKFGDHNIETLLLAETTNRQANSFSATGYGFDIYELDELAFSNDPTKNNVSGGSSQARVAGFLGRVTYNFKNKYFGEASLRYDGSYVFGGMVPGKRWSPFPAGSLGWRISEENWYNENLFVNELKLRASVGLTGTTGINPYYFLSTLDYMDAPAVVLDGLPQQGMITSTPGNANLSWEKALQYNLGFDASLWNGLLNVEFDVFYKYLYDVLVATSQIPDSWGGYKPGYENIAKIDRKGFDFTITHRNRLGEFGYGITLNATLAKRRWLSYPDAPNRPDWLKLTGKAEGAQVGFLADGLFQSEEEIDNAATLESARPMVGDIRYVDRNGDGIISYAQDRGYVGKSPYPNIIAGLGLDFDWKGLSLSVLFQSGLDRDVAMTGVYPDGTMSLTSMTRPFYGGGNAPYYLVENSWTEQNRAAEFPRLTIANTGNNGYSSTFWYRNGNYVRLKTLQIGYSLPTKWLKPRKIQQVRFFIEGQNVFTISPLTKYGLDPERPGVSNGYYPQQMVTNLGLNLVF